MSETRPDNHAYADLPAAMSLRALSEETANPPLRRALRELSERLERGVPLAEAVQGGNVPGELRMLLDAGIDSERIPHAVGRFVEAERDHSENRRRVLMSFAYPVVIFVMGVGILLFILLKITPQFREMFKDFDFELPGLTAAYMHLSTFLVEYGWYLLGGLVLLGAAGVALYARIRLPWSAPSAKPPSDSEVAQAAGLQRLTNAIPLFGWTRRMDALARFCRLLALLVESEVPLPAALEAAARGAQDADLLESARQLARRVRDGEGLRESAMVMPAFPKVFVNALRWETQGEAFADVLRSTAQTFSSRARIQAALSCLLAEPIAILVVLSIIGVTVVALFLPLVTLLNYLA